MDIFDILLPPFYLIIILQLGYKYKSNKELIDPSYRYFLPGLSVKILGSIALGLVYFFYYGGGDTVNYYYTCCAFINLLVDAPADFMYVFFGSPAKSEYYLMDTTGEFAYWVNDPYAFFVSKCLFPFVLLGFKTYMTSAILIASLCYISVWKMYQIFILEFPHLQKQLAIAILFIPSVVFWGSGIMKDSITFSATCLFVYGFYWFVVKKKYNLTFGLSIFFASYFLLNIKPYILFALLPGSTVWFMALKMTNIKNGFIRIMLAPTIITVGIVGTYYIMDQLGDKLGKYSIEKVFSTAQGAQQDLMRAAYQGNSFDIGDYEATPLGLLSVSHKAIFAAIFRPTILDVKNIVMFVSALENTFMLLFCFYLLIKLKVFKFFLLIRSHPLVTFSFIFSIFFALSVGVSISNFGTLVRLKIPCIPFFVASLVIVNDMLKRNPDELISSST